MDSASSGCLNRTHLDPRLNLDGLSYSLFAIYPDGQRPSGDGVRSGCLEVCVAIVDITSEAVGLSIIERCRQ
jgi:hypothetical protein